MAMRKLKKYKQTKFRARGSKYNKDAADFAVAFIESLCHTKGTWAGKKFELFGVIIITFFRGCYNLESAVFQILDGISQILFAAYGKSVQSSC